MSSIDLGEDIASVDEEYFLVGFGDGFPVLFENGFTRLYVHAQWEP